MTQPNEKLKGKCEYCKKGEFFNCHCECHHASKRECVHQLRTCEKEGCEHRFRFCEKCKETVESPKDLREEKPADWGKELRKDCIDCDKIKGYCQKHSTSGIAYTTKDNKSILQELKDMEESFIEYEKTGIKPYWNGYAFSNEWSFFEDFISNLLSEAVEGERNKKENRMLQGYEEGKESGIISERQRILSACEGRRKDESGQTHEYPFYSNYKAYNQALSDLVKIIKNQ